MALRLRSPTRNRSIPTSSSVLCFEHAGEGDDSAIKKVAQSALGPSDLEFFLSGQIETLCLEIELVFLFGNIAIGKFAVDILLSGNQRGLGQLLVVLGNLDLLTIL